MNYLTVHICNLLTHLGDFLLTRTDVPLQFLYLIVQHKFELLELLSFLFEFVDTSHLISNSLLSFFNFFCLGLLSL
jgi:hypothetical protein